MATVKEMALAVAAALEDESKWCRGAEARNDEGLSTGYRRQDACRWCAQGHAWRMFGAATDDTLALQDAYRVRFRTYIFEDNDHPTRGRVFVRDRLLELAEGQSDLPYS